MTPAYLNSSSPSLFAAELDGKDQHHQHSLISSNLQPSSSSSLSCHIYFHSSTTTHDQSGYCHSWETHQQQYQQEVDNNLGSHGGAYDDDVENESDDNGLKLSLWKKEGKNENQSDDISVKWMSSKMRLMQNMKTNSDHDQNQIAGVDMIFPNSTSTTTTHKFEDHKVHDPLSPPAVDTDNSSSNNNNNNIPVRVCADCKTTKTPLWRSGPRGPKSLCNACGIRQRKARRAMAAANGTIVGGDQASPMKSKVEHRDKRSKNGHVGKYKKRSKMANPSDHTRKRLCFEDFLISLSKNLAFHRVFPQDEKEAAILLMSLSCGFVHD